ncbi:MAG: YggS family pyridoxal phosphate-dependent enzyme [Roseburia sp.]|nr:YggS family pyridoxal phosphate-dependent enzyme [Anaeroplasma bactoclasticum]MCM1196090.1 YggS family pyridoxal phosphate-dependent enzyme [Roseburia sp.]MCM1557330.1 YggS family pyridoxal phosphate-dependent enzyme [Anaeroplasma bactoclasticum]
MELTKDVKEKLNFIPNHVRIVAATKYVAAEDMKKLFSIGIHNFGENRVDSFLKKYEALKNEDICWHFIGHLQTNKAKQVLSKIDVLHSLDSLKLAEIIEKERTTPLDCFIEVNINKEKSKNGIAIEDCEAFLKKISSYSNVKVVGFMMMTTKDSTKEEKRIQFSNLRKLMQEMNEKLGLELKQLSMGMSDDYIEAIAEGATMVRLGRMLWHQER